MGLQDVFFKSRLPFDGEDARALSRRISAEVYFHALRTSCDLAREHGAHPGISQTRAASAELQFDSWRLTPDDTHRWSDLESQTLTHGRRNTFFIAINATATS